MADDLAPTGTLRLELFRSLIGKTQRQRATVQALGLRKLNQVVEHSDTLAIRGMVLKVPHLVRIVEES